MKEENISFEVKNNKFWILEQRLEEEMEKQEKEYKVNAWVFNNEQEAITKLKGLVTQEKMDLGKLDELADKLGAKYNLQEVEIARDKYNMKAISWLKVALLGFAEK